MKLSKLIALVSFAAFTQMSMAAMSFAPYEAIVASSGDIVLGEWNSSIEKGRAFADENNIPMLVFGGSPTCGHCHSMQTACNTEEFKAWAAEKRLVMVYGTSNDIKAFCRDADSSLTALPLMSIYWKKADGSVVWKSFTGMLGSMPSTTGDTLAAQLINSCELYIGGWPQLAGLESLAFTSSYEGARLEAEAGVTKFVDVPLERDAYMQGYSSTNRLTAVYGGQTILNQTVVWDANALEMSVRVAIPSGAGAGDEIGVTLYSSTGEERGSVKIFVVEAQENSPKNPLFIGERTAQTLGYGEWTMDLDVALAKYAAEAASKLLVLVGGSLWCPDCVMTDVHLLDTDGFKEWAVSNKVILVNIDIPNNPNEPEGTPCLLTRTVSEASANYRSGRGTIANEGEWQEAHQCGAGYLSRHMVTDAAAAAAYERNRRLASTNWTVGGWNNPERANQNRPGVPVFYTLTRQGTVAGCFDTFASTAPRSYDAAYLARLEELLALADGTSLLDSSWQTTTLSYDGTSAKGFSGALSAVDLTDAIALGTLDMIAAKQTITVRGTDSSVAITVNIVSVSEGEATTVATATDTLSSGVTLSCTMTPAEQYYVKVTASAAGTLSPDAAAANTSVAYTMTGTREEIENPFHNEWITSARKATLPLYAADGVSLAGFLELQLRKNGKVSAKISNAKKRLATLSGKWSDEISADGTATAKLEKKGYVVSLRITSEGVVTAVVSGAAALTSGKCALAEDYGDFVGSYAVALPLLDAAGVYCGDAYMTLSMASSATARKNGVMKYRVFLPDGKKLSGTTGVTGYDADFGVAPIAKASGVNSFAAAILVRRSAGTAPTRRAVIAVDGVKAVWNGSGFSRECGVYGSFIRSSDSLVTHSGVTQVAVAFDKSSIATSERFGALVSALYDGGAMSITAGSIAPAETVKNFRFKLNRATGVFQGRTALSFTGKERVNAKFTGVILPDWYSDCQCEEDGDTVVSKVFLPFGVGQCIFADKIGGKSVKRSFPMALE